MPMRRFTSLIGLSVSLLSLTSVHAQDKQPLAPPAVQLTEAEKRFEAQIIAAEAILTKSRPFNVTIDSNWKSAGAGHDRKGANHFHVTIGKDPTQFRIEAGLA